MLTKNKTIVLVEDNEVQRQLFIDGLEDEGFAVRAFAGLHDVPRDFNGDAPDLFIVDIMLGADKYGGIEFVEGMLRTLPNARFLFISAYEDVTARAHMNKRLERIELLEKPFTYEKLMQKVREVLAS